jgi:hypothetical protein
MAKPASAFYMAEAAFVYYCKIRGHVCPSVSAQQLPVVDVASNTPPLQFVPKISKLPAS